MYTTKGRIYGQAPDGRTILLFRAGQVITDDQAKAAGLIPGDPSPKDPATGLVVEDSSKAAADDSPTQSKPLEKMKLAELKGVCEDPSLVGLELERIDPDGANTRAEYIAVIEAALQEASA